MTQHRIKQRREVGFQPADRPFKNRPRVRVSVKISTKTRDLPRRSTLLGGRQEGQIGARRADCLDACQLLAELRGNPRQCRFEHRIRGDLAPLRGAGDPPHHKEWFADHSRIGAGEERLGNRDPGREHGLQNRKFIGARQAGPDPGRRVGAQDETLPSGKRAIRKRGVDTPILLDRATGKQVTGGDFDRCRPARLRQKARQRGEIKSRQRRDRHRPR